MTSWRVIAKKMGRPAATAVLGAALGRINHRFRRRHDGNRHSRSVTRATRLTWCSTRWGTYSRGRLGCPIAPQLPRITQLASTGRHRHQQEDQYPQPFHPAGLLSWQVSFIQFQAILGNCAPWRCACNLKSAAAPRFLPLPAVGGARRSAWRNCKGDFSLGCS